MYTELRTRIATQPLPLRSGIEVTALKSLVDLFPLVRRSLADFPQAQHTAALVVHCLNEHIRPMTALWHPRAEAGALSGLDQRFEFRAQLAALQQTLRALASVLGQICEDQDAKQFLLPMRHEPWNTHTQQGHLKYGISSVSSHEDVIKKMNAVERTILNLRRGESPADKDAPIQDAVGLALSGGGIRSATFGLGIVQVLARRGILKQVDVMSTVSGGGYLGSFITSVLSDSESGVGLAPDQAPFADLDNIESKPIRYLCNHSKYLSEGGLATFALMIFSTAYGVAMSILLVAPWLMLLAMLAVYGFGLGTDKSGVIDIDSSLLSGGLWVALASVVVLLSVMSRPSGTARAFVERTAIILFFSALAVWAWQWLEKLYDLTHGQTVVMLGVIPLLPVLLGVSGIWWGPDRLRGRLALSLLVVVGPLFLLSLWLIAVNMAISIRNWNWLWTFLLVVGLLAYACLLVNVNFASLHLYYRTRLARTYLRRVYLDDAVDPQPLSGLNSSNKAPLHLIIDISLIHDNR